MIQQLANWSKLEALHQPTSQPPHFFDLNKGLMHSPTLIPRGPIDFLKTIAPPTLPTLTRCQLSLLYVYIYIAPSALLNSIHRLHTHKRRREEKNMAHLLNKPLFFTLLTIILLSSPRLLASYLPISPNIARFLPLAPLILYLFYSISKRSASLPPGPLSIPIFGNWLQVGNDLNHQLLASMAQKYGPVFLLKLGSKNLTVVSDPELASQVLHTQGVEFGSRPRNVVFDIFSGNGQDMVFTVYGDHWRKMRRIMTLPFFTNKVVHQYSEMWEEEMDLVVDDLRNKESVKTEGLVIRKRLQLMLYNIMYRMMFDAKFESQEDPLFIQATRFNSERSRLAQSFDYNYGDFIPLLRPFLRGYLNKCRELQSSRLAFFNNYYVEKRR